MWTRTVGVRRRESQGTALRYIVAILSLVLLLAATHRLAAFEDLVACVACDSSFECRYRPHEPTWLGFTAPYGSKTVASLALG